MNPAQWTEPFPAVLCIGARGVTPHPRISWMRYDVNRVLAVGGTGVSVAGAVLWAVDDAAIVLTVPVIPGLERADA